MATADPNLQAPLRKLGAKDPGPCIITTRQHMTDLDRFEGRGVRQEKLEYLPNEGGAALLRALGVKDRGREPEERVSSE